MLHPRPSGDNVVTSAVSFNTKHAIEQIAEINKRCRTLVAGLEISSLGRGEAVVQSRRAAIATQYLDSSKASQLLKMPNSKDKLVGKKIVVVGGSSG